MKQVVGLQPFASVRVTQLQHSSPLKNYLLDAFTDFSERLASSEVQ